jgi:uncharacterized membrane protein YgaE (UPF0421/DUF939 family)
MGKIVTWGGFLLALALAATFGSWSLVSFWLRSFFALMVVVGDFLQQGVVSSCVGLGLIMYIYPHAISLLFFFSFFSSFSSDRFRQGSNSNS